MNSLKILTWALFGLCTLVTPLSIYAHHDASPSTYAIRGLSSELTAVITTRLKELPSRLSPERRFERAQAVIQSLLQSHGYFRADIQTRIHKDSKVPHIVYNISKGPQLAMTSISIEFIGDRSNLNLERKRDELIGKQGEPMTNDNYQAIKQSLTTLLAAEGYVKAIWKTHGVAIDLEQYTATITILIDTGPRHTVGPIQFSAHSLNDSLLRSYLDFKEGNPYQLNQILQSQYQLEKSGYFQKVLIRADADHPSLRFPIDVDLTQAPNYYTIATLGVKTNLHPHLKVEGLVRRLNQAGHQLAGMTKFSSDYLDTLGVYTIPGRLPAFHKHQLKLHCVHYPNFFPNHRIHSKPFIQNSTTTSYVYTHLWHAWELSSDVALHYEYFKTLNDAKDSYYRGLLVGILLRNTPEHWSFKAVHNYHIDCSVKLGTPFASFPFLRIETSSVYSHRLRQIPLSYCIVRGRAGRCFGSYSQAMPTSLRFQAGNDNSPRGHPVYLLGAHFLSGGVEGRIQLASLLYLSPYLELIYDSGYIKPVRGSTGIGLCLWYPRIGNLEISGVIRINPEPTQGRYGVVAKLSTHP